MSLRKFYFIKYANNYSYVNISYIKPKALILMIRGHFFSYETGNGPIALLLIMPKLYPYGMSSCKESGYWK